MYLTIYIPNERGEKSRSSLLQQVLKISTFGIDTGLQTLLERIYDVKKLLGRNLTIGATQCDLQNFNSSKLCSLKRAEQFLRIELFIELKSREYGRQPFLHQKFQNFFSVENFLILHKRDG
jgi:hypothetical protein